jgi:hypothetical protein
MHFFDADPDTDLNFYFDARILPPSQVDNYLNKL